MNALKRILARQAEAETKRVSASAPSSMLERIRARVPSQTETSVPALPRAAPAPFSDAKARGIASIVDKFREDKKYRTQGWGAPSPVFYQRERDAFEPGVRSVDTAITYSDLSPDQKNAYDAVMDWHESGDEVLTFAGFAGTGKTTVLGLLARELTKNKRVAFCAYTGKASSVLCEKLRRQGVETTRGGRHHGGTIHSLMYRPVADEDEILLDWSKRNTIDYDLIVVDEASMVRLSVFQDLMSYGVPILLVGDHGQLPPVSDGTGGDIGLMDEPDVRLEKIHRQAEGNEIIAWSRYVREHGDLPDDMSDGKHVRSVGVSEAEHVLRELYTKSKAEDVATLVYTNRERKIWNQLARAARGISGDDPVRGDQVICLRNTRGILFNGTRGTIESDPVDQGLWASAKFWFPDDDLEVSGWMLKEQLVQERTLTNPVQVEEATGFRPRPFERAGLLLDYGYALTTHKFQGSQAKHVVFVPRFSSMMTESDYQKWLYTSITRASETLTIVR